ncbi:LysR family transcriptional regulator [Alkalicoccus luteus]|uniref:LysR family transcriptional regulator n=1 Tax=Alkalicoccus luteus TaxID=1237094 RepID=A0A969PMX8_9BACI|nr:LysR family transcriptional regulator [Alkalicoccus luteus]NJP36238.1 LysR family transcriptional regulator [Alkalicoccus luteus]
MKWKQIEVFYTFSQLQNVSRTAEELGVKQPTVTFHLKQLEQSIGTPLFERKGEQVTLTPAGAALRHYSRELMALFRETERVMRDYRDKKGELFLGASYIPANYVLPPILYQFQQKTPDVQLRISIQPAPQTADDIIMKRLDIGIVSEQNLTTSKLTVKRLCPDDVVLVTPPGHPLLDSTQLEADIERFPLLLHQSGSTRDIVNDWAAEEKLNLNVAMELTNVEAIRSLVRLGSGCAILSSRAVEEDLAAGKLAIRPLPYEQASRWISLIYRKDRPVTPIMESFFTELYSGIGYSETET